MIEITSKENKIIKNYLKLLCKRDRDETGLYLDYGLHSLSETEDKSLIVDVLSENPKIATIKTTSSVLKLFQNNKSVIDPVIIVRKKQPSSELGNIVFLDGVQNPENVGAIVRSALAFGINTIVLNDQCADIYSEKSTRSCQGAITKLNILKISDSKFFLDNLVKKGYSIFATLLSDSSTTNVRNAIFSTCNCFVFGSEGKGINKLILPAKIHNVIIPIKNIDSLNVGVAASIILYEWSNQR